jgi:hypothetical protein
MRKTDREDVLNSMRARYGSLSDPDFSFLHFDDGPVVMDELRGALKGAEVTDDTDPDTDVCFSFLVRMGKSQRFLQLSRVGPYACVRVVGHEERYLRRGDAHEPIDEQILAYVDRKGLALLEPELLSVRLPELHLFATEPEVVAVYHGLFSDDGRDVSV